MTEDSSESPMGMDNEKFCPKVRWVLPHRLDHMTFIGKDIFAIAHDIYIVFFNFRTNTEVVYVANNKKKGDGVDVIAGHRTHIFAFAEKVKHARIFIMTFPSFNILAELRDTDVNRYKGLCMMECDLVAGFSGFPNYMFSVWGWRTNQRLLSVPTGIIRRSQIYAASRTHMLVCECWGEGLAVWEVAQCYKRCLVLQRRKHEAQEWEVSEPPLVAACWASGGELYVLDPTANLYCMVSDGIDMVSNLEWSEDLKGTHKPSICSFGNGLLVYGPDNCLRFLKKTESHWKVVFKFTPHDEVVRLVSDSTSEIAAMWTAKGMLYKITAESDEHLDVSLFTFKQRHITKIQLIAPDYVHLATINDTGVLCIYEVMTGKLVTIKSVEGSDVSFEASPVEPLVAVFGEVGHNYGLRLLLLREGGLRRAGGAGNAGGTCLTHQIVSRVAFSSTGRELLAAAMSAGHVFIYKLSEDYKLTLVRYTELGRGLADCFLMRVGDQMRAFSLVLYSDKYPIGERVICINAETGKDNKFAGKMLGPYSRLLPLSARDSMLAVPHLSKHYHVLLLSGEKGVTVSVKMGPIIDSGHDIKQFNGVYNLGALLTFGYDGNIILRQPHAPEQYDLKLVVTHRYESGIKQAVIDSENKYIVHESGNRTVVCTYLHAHDDQLTDELHHQAISTDMFEDIETLTIISEDDKNYLELQEEKRVHEEAMDYKRQREDVVRTFEAIREKLVELLEQNLSERSLHQLSLAEFNLHQEHKKERLKQAEKEREIIRLQTEARIVAQDKVTAWIKRQCWDTMLTPRVKLFAIFSHYHVENYAVLPTQRERWPELQQAAALRALEADNDHDLLRPWEETPLRAASASGGPLDAAGGSLGSVKEVRRSMDSGAEAEAGAGAGAGVQEGAGEAAEGQPHVLAGSSAHRFLAVPPCMVPQTLAYSFLQMNWLQHIVKLNVQNMRLWFNKQFDELMSTKKREVGLVEERNARLRFIIEEVNKLSNLRGSFHHLTIEIRDPEWRQEEQPHKLIKVEPEECSIEPYVSPSQVVVAPPEPKPKDDFRERALMDMMDGVLEKLWHEEIKKPIPMPQCMLEKDPEHFNEDDLRLVFEYEAKVAFRNEERDKYRKMLHAEYGKLSQLLNEGVVKFNQKVKETWLTKLKVDSVIGQENLNLMRLRRTNLDRVEMAEKLEDMRREVGGCARAAEALARAARRAHEQAAEGGAALEALAQRDRHLDRTFRNHFADLSPIIVDQCYKFFKKRPKWHQRASLTPDVLHELAQGVLAGVRPPLLHADCVDYFKGVDQLDQLSNMPPVMDEGLWATMCKLRRAKIENEIRMRAMSQELAYVESAVAAWGRALQARRARLALLQDRIQHHRDAVEHASRNRTIQLVLPAGQVEILTTGHMADFEDATLILREDIEKINNVILQVGEMKLRMMRKQMEFRKGILAKEWEHAQMKMKLRHMEQELYSYRRLKIPKELQLYLKNKELGYTDEQDYVRMEKEMEASKVSVNKILNEQMHRVEELEVKLNSLEASATQLEKLIVGLNVKVSEKRLNEDPLEPIRVRRRIKKRLETLAARARLVRGVQRGHARQVLLQTQLELLRLRTYPTLASFRTFT